MTYLRKILLLLVLRSVPNYLIDAEVGVSAIAQCNSSAGSRNLLHGNAVLQIAKPSTAILVCKGENTPLIQEAGATRCYDNIVLVQRKQESVVQHTN